MLLEDVEQIEVVRGPGATLWGANAVNGIINIVTRSAKDTQGGLLAAGAGTEERAYGGFRYGGGIGDSWHYRVYAKSFGRDASARSSGSRAADEWEQLQTGFRIDWEPATSDSLTLQGGLYAGDSGQTVTFAFLTEPYERTFDEPIETSGGNVLGRWKRSFSGGSEIALQMYYDRWKRQEGTGLEVFSDTYDVDFQHRFAFAGRHELLWGLGYRSTRDGVEGERASLMETHGPRRLAGAFFQDRIRLGGDRVELLLGSKFEYEHHAGGDFQPNARVLWRLGDNDVLWGSVAKANRMPSQADLHARFNVGAFPSADGSLTLLTLFGNPERAAENVVAFEAGFGEGDAVHVAQHHGWAEAELLDRTR